LNKKIVNYFLLLKPAILYDIKKQLKNLIYLLKDFLYSNLVAFLSFDDQSLYEIKEYRYKKN